MKFQFFGLLLLAFWNFGTCQDNSNRIDLGDDFWEAVGQHEDRVAAMTPSPEPPSSQRTWAESSDGLPRRSEGRVAPRERELSPDPPRTEFPQTLTRGERRDYEVRFKLCIALS